MNREEEIQRLAKQIQDRINKLKKLNCFITYRHEGLCLFDDDIEIDEDWRKEEESNRVVFGFQTSRV
jgi:hypothetical protein